MHYLVVVGVRQISGVLMKENENSPFPDVFSNGDACAFGRHWCSFYLSGRSITILLTLPVMVSLCSNHLYIHLLENLYDFKAASETLVHRGWGR